MQLIKYMERHLMKHENRLQQLRSYIDGMIRYCIIVPRTKSSLKSRIAIEFDLNI